MPKELYTRWEKKTTHLAFFPNERDMDAFIAAMTINCDTCESTQLMDKTWELHWTTSEILFG